MSVTWMPGTQVRVTDHEGHAIAGTWRPAPGEQPSRIRLIVEVGDRRTDVIIMEGGVKGPARWDRRAGQVSLPFSRGDLAQQGLALFTALICDALANTLVP